jgi:uncharacterized protein YbcI
MVGFDGQLARDEGIVGAAISNAVVGLVRQYTGRGPTKARTSISRDLVSVVMADTLTQAERRLADDGKRDFVLQIRHEFQKTMRDELVAAVEKITERKVIAFMSDNHIDPDMAVESFVLRPEPEAGALLPDRRK